VRCGIGHADAAERRIDVEGVTEHAVANPPAFTVKEVGGDDREIIVRCVGERAAPVAVAERPDPRHIGGKPVVDLDVANRNAAVSLPGPRAKSRKLSMPRFSRMIGMPSSGSSALMRTPAPIPGVSLETFSKYELP